MNVAIYNNYSNQNQKQYELPLTFYDDISQIIKFFRRQLNLHIKLSSACYEDKQIMDEIQNKKTQGLQIAKPYEVFIMMQNYYGIMQRFIGRIKQILQFTNNLAPGVIQFVTAGIKKIQIFVHKNVTQITIFQIINDILNLIPSYYKNKTYSPQKIKIKVKQNKQNIPFFQRKTNTLDLILQSYKKNYSLISILDLDQPQYRSLFFSARQDKSRGTNFLQNDMKYRNRFIREQMQKYDMDFQSYRQKLKRVQYISNKRKISKIKRMMSLNSKSDHGQYINNSFQQKKSGKCVSPILNTISQNKIIQKSDSIIQKQHSYLPKSNLLTTAYNFNQTLIQQQYSTPSKPYQRYKQRFNRTKDQYKKSPSPKSKLDFTSANYSDKIRQQQFQDFINEIKGKGQFRMTKVLFGKDGKLQLSPHIDIKSNHNKEVSNSNQIGMKNRIIFRKVQQNIRKKLNRITTQPPTQTIKSIPQQIIKPSRVITQTSKQDIYQHKYNNSSNIIQPEQQPNNNYIYQKYQKYQRKNYVCIQCPQNKKSGPMTNKKNKKITWKDKQIKFLGIKGVNNNCFLDTKTNFNVKQTLANYDAEKSLLLGSGVNKFNQTKNHSFHQ